MFSRKYNYRLYKIHTKTEVKKDGTPVLRDYGYGVKYQNTTALLVEAVKQLTQQVKDLKTEIRNLLPETDFSLLLFLNCLFLLLFIFFILFTFSSLLFLKQTDFVL